MKRSTEFNLGQDETRIKDQRDARRQELTVDRLLERLFHSNPSRRRELQILADEVGMGKTFVGLGVAYSLLAAMRDGEHDAVDLRGCYQKVLIITPRNSALFRKWTREVGEFVKRCVLEEHQHEARRWFSSVPVKRLDDLVVELRRRGAGPRIIVASMSIFAGGRLTNYDLKRQQLLAVLFRLWGTRFRNWQRRNLLKGASTDWPAHPDELGQFPEQHLQKLPFFDEELLAALCRLAYRSDVIERLLESCREMAAPYVRGRDKLFPQVTKQLDGIYRELMADLIGSDIPLSIVDEAHNWKNGPSSGKNGYREFARMIAPQTRRALLLTATPFQLRPTEMLELLRVSDDLRPCPTDAASLARRECLRKLREDVIRPVLDRSALSSRRFGQAWSKLPPGVTTESLASAWARESVVNAREQLQALATEPDLVCRNRADAITGRAVSGLDPAVRQFVREALLLLAFNADLSGEMGSLVIRHRRATRHRRVLVGSEYQQAPNETEHRPDQHTLHSAPGIDVRGDEELPHFLLMRCVSEASHGRGRTSLGTAMTGCYSTLMESAEGRLLRNRLRRDETGAIYFKLLQKMTSVRRDGRHPKVREVVRKVVANWHAGEKTLIFCFRTNTAKRLQEILDREIGRELRQRRNRCLGDAIALKALRSRLTGRDRDLIPIILDRVLWSVLWSTRLRTMTRRPPVPSDLELNDVEMLSLAEYSLRAGVNLLAERVDRVFLHRCVETIVARRLLNELEPHGPLLDLLRSVACESWIERSHGVSSDGEQAQAGVDQIHADERGVHTAYSLRHVTAHSSAVRIAAAIRERRDRVRAQGRLSIFDTYGRGPNLWLGIDPHASWESAGTGATQSVTAMHGMHRHLHTLTTGDDGTFDWKSRRAILESMRRVVLRESLLVRMLPAQHAREHAQWSELLVERFFQSLPGQRESVADRVAVFLEDFASASGNITDVTSARYSLYEATRLQDRQSVRLVLGSTDHATRERLFAGFNTPLLPEVLVCTSVGQEGIDLHRHCRHVVHFDLPWNPAVMEQRTGRTDRIGSKTFRERAHDNGTSASFLEIGAPYLAGTYDERVFEELRLRAQTFEVLTGGDLAADRADVSDEHRHAEGQATGVHLVPLPEELVSSLRVNLHVWP